MGEIADMMLEGDMCECCGEWLGDGGSGFPRYCSAECARDRGADHVQVKEKKKKTIVKDGEAFLSEKLFKRLKYLVIYGTSDGPLTCAAGQNMYAGDIWDGAARQYQKLERLGFVQQRSPSNPIHKTRAVITQKGIDFLTERGALKKEKKK